MSSTTLPKKFQHLLEHLVTYENIKGNKTEKPEIDTYDPVFVFEDNAVITYIAQVKATNGEMLYIEERLLHNKI